MRRRLLTWYYASEFYRLTYIHEHNHSYIRIHCEASCYGVIPYTYMLSKIRPTYGCALTTLVCTKGKQIRAHETFSKLFFLFSFFLTRYLHFSRRIRRSFQSCIRSNFRKYDLTPQVRIVSQLITIFLFCANLQEGIYIRVGRQVGRQVFHLLSLCQKRFNLKLEYIRCTRMYVSDSMKILGYTCVDNNITPRALENVLFVCLRGLQRLVQRSFWKK